MPFLAYLFIYFYTFSNHITFPMQPRPHPPPSQTQKSRPRDSIESQSREYLIPIYQLIFPKLGIPLFIQRLVFRVLTLVLRNDLLHLAHYLHVVEGLSYA
jgi:hypothetical protein